ncbi:hypothetical protein VTK73DRAFT_7636 [Phialemonium thermophilum]|uniref:Nuclear pore complex protein n=1 Tax=Phialemonium thermophilum TaxID=223376 RepID=A0ABR3Y713_9PEZI
MAPSYQLPMLSPSDSLVDVQNPHPDTSTDKFAELEATYQSSAIQAGPEVEEFASALDKFTVLRGSVAEKRAQIFRLVDHYYSYTRQRARELKQRQSEKSRSRRRGWRTGRAASNSGRDSVEMDLDEGDDGTSLADGQGTVKKLEDEAQIWDLLRRILPLRYRDHTHSQNKRLGDGPSLSRKQLWNEFVLSDSIARERKVVLEWLQDSANNGPSIEEVVKDLQENAERGDILSHGWLHTRHKIKLQKSVNVYQGVLDPDDPGLADSHLGSNTLITQLDPDAMTRQGRRLEPQDESFERAIWLGCFEMLRRGKSMAEIREWCAERTESWRAATISKLPLSSLDDEDVDNFDPASVVLWRRMCYATARDGGTSDFERAVYGVLSGDVTSVERVCKTWDDFLFANYNALLRSQFDAFLIKHGGLEAATVAQTFPALNAVQQHGDPVTAGKRLVAALETNDRTKTEAFTMVKALQGAIVANDLDRHLYQQGLVLSKLANKRQKSKIIPDYGIPVVEENEKYVDLLNHDGLRVLAHILIVISTLDRLSGFSRDDGGFGPIHIRHRVQEHIIEAYISFLRLADLELIVPLYCSKLLGSRVYETLSRNLISVVDQEARVHQLGIMKRLGLDVAEFARTQPRIYLEDVGDLQIPCEAKGKFKILQDGPPTLKYGRLVKPDFFGEDPEFVDREDDLIIRAMEWLMLVPGLFLESCTFAIRTYKYFLKRMHLRACRALFNRVPAKDLVLEKTCIPLGVSYDNDNPAWFEEFEGAELPEDLLEQCGLSREELVTLVRNLWELECLVRALDSMETLSSVAELSREDSATSREMWQRAGREIRLAKACMKPLQSNWLLITNEEDPDFADLREAYLPETILAYVSSLHFIGTSLSRDYLLECMELAAVFAEKKSDVARQFVQAGRMKELLDSFAACSKALAIWTTEKKGAQTSSKKFKENGWSRELWSIRP